MVKRRILIVEDEALISTGIMITLSQNEYECKVVDNGDNAINSLQTFSPHLILMDIGLKGKLDGLSTAAIIRKQSNVQIVFISDQKSWSIFELAKESKPANYINKPFSDGELLKAVELAMSQNTRSENPEYHSELRETVLDGVFVFSGEEYKKILLADILFVQAEGMTTTLYCTNKKTYRVSQSSNHIISQLNYPSLVRTSKSSYVNIHKVDSIKSDELKLEEYSVTLSKTYKEEFLARIKKLKQNKSGY